MVHLPEALCQTLILHSVDRYLQVLLVFPLVVKQDDRHSRKDLRPVQACFILINLITNPSIEPDQHLDPDLKEVLERWKM